jgi:hypothetical protein
MNFSAASHMNFSAASYMSRSPICLSNLEFGLCTVNRRPAMVPGNIINEYYLCSECKMMIGQN